MRTESRLGLKGRSITFLVFLLLGTVCAISIALITQHYRESIDQVTEHAIVQAKSISTTVEPHVLLNDTQALQHVLQGAANATELVAVDIVDGKGSVLAQFRRHADFVPEIQCDLEYAVSEQLEPQESHIKMGTNQLHVVVPIRVNVGGMELGLAEDNEKAAPGVLGFVCLTYTLREVYADLRASILTSLVISIVVIALGTGVTIVKVRQLVKPIEDLAKAATAIANGDLSKRASEDASAEIGVLAQSFNHMAETIWQHTADLEAQVSKRTAELAEALHRVEAATLAKSEFLANMSHEIRTPMTAIIGYTDVLIEESQDSLSSEPLGIIKRNGVYLLSIINDILDLSKIEAGKMSVEQIDTSPVSLVAEVQSLMQVRAESKGLAFDISIVDAIPEKIQSDPLRLRQILINLIGNAIKFTEQGVIKLVMRFVESADQNITDVMRSTARSTDDFLEPKRIKPGDPYLRLDVIDTGIGISAEEQARLFQPFSQADTSIRRRFGGTGLGLTISMRLAEMLGGAVVVESEPGKGSTFSLFVATGPVEGIKRVVGDPLKMTDKAGNFAGQQGPRAQLNCRILLAEDGRDNQRLISHILKKAGAQVTLAENGSIAVGLAIKAEQTGNGFDIILMDMQMPVLDGYGATEHLRKLGYERPIIALTAHTMSGDRDKCLSAGCTDYATKPIERDKLFDTILKHLNPTDTDQETPVLVESSSQV